MPEDKTVPEQPENGTQTVPAAEPKTTDNDGHMIPKDRFDEINNKYKELQKQIDAKDKALREAQEARLKENEDYKALYEQTTSRLSELEPKAEQLDAAMETMTALLESEIADLPEDLRDIIPDELSVKAKLDWLRKHKAKLLKPIAPDIGAGQRGASGGSPIVLTPEEKQVAKAFGYTDEEYIKYRNDNDA